MSALYAPDTILGVFHSFPFNTSVILDVYLNHLKWFKWGLSFPFYKQENWTQRTHTASEFERKSNIRNQILIFSIFYWLCYYSCPIFFSLLFPSTLYPPPSPPAFPCLSSCPWVIHISSLASPSPILFLTSLCLFCTYHLCFLFSVPFPPFPPASLTTLHVISVSVNLLLF